MLTFCTYPESTPIGALRTEDEVSTGAVHPPAHFEHNVDSLVFVWVEPRVAGILAGDGRFSGAVFALKDEGVRESGHGKTVGFSGYSIQELSPLSGRETRVGSFSASTRIVRESGLR